MQGLELLQGGQRGGDLALCPHNHQQRCPSENHGAGGCQQPAAGRTVSTVSTAGTVGTTGTLGTVSTVGTMGTVAPFPSQGCNFGLLARCCARPAAVPRAPGHRCFVPRDKAPSRGRAEAPPRAGARLPLIELGARHGAEGWQ